jgi:5'-nucleotidase
MPFNLTDKLVVGIASTALFDLADADRVFREQNLSAYRKYMRAKESARLEAGTGFPLVKGLLGINKLAGEALVEVILMSKNDADSGYRILNSIEQWDLKISRAAFTDGRPPSEYLEAFSCNLYLTTIREEVVKAIKSGFPAALVYAPPKDVDLSSNEVRIAFDGDAVLFSDESDRVFRRGGLEAFEQHETKFENVPLKEGPLKGFLDAISRIQERFPEGGNGIKCPIRTSLVTARGMPAHKRPINTLRKWNIRLDESFFLGGVEKASVLKVLKPHIFFDDQKSNLDPCKTDLPVAEVPVNGDADGGIEYR